MRTRTKWGGLFGVSMVLVGCSTGGLSPRGGGPAEEGLLSGTYTFERPEVGNIDGCTATLVGERLVVTAAHCVDFTDEPGPGRFNTFVVDDGARRFSYDVDRVAVFGSEPGDDDVALLHLATAVPASVATPAPIGRSMPAPGETLTTYGYGCQERARTSGPFRKQRLEHVMGRDTHALCPGDSGGPTFSPDGRVLLVNSAYIVGEGTDLFGSVVLTADRLAAQAAVWGETLATDPGAPPSDPGPPPTDPGTTPTDPGTPPTDPGTTPSDCLAATSCEEATPLDGCGWCGATGAPVTVDGCGYPIDDCAGDFRLNPGDCDGGASAGSCTCVDGVTFDCGETTLACPDGSYCIPGTDALECWLL